MHNSEGVVSAMSQANDPGQAAEELGEILIVMHGALRNGDLMSEAIIERAKASAYAALA